MAAMERIVLAGCSCVLVWAFSLPWNFVFCSLSREDLSRQLWLCRFSAQRAFTWAQQAGCPSCLLHPGTHSRWNHQCKTVPYCSADYLTLIRKLCHEPEYLSNPVQINFSATGTFAANDFYSALPTPVRLLKYSSCLSWPRWCMCFIIMLICYICCIIAYTSLSSF